MGQDGNHLSAKEATVCSAGEYHHENRVFLTVGVCAMLTWTRPQGAIVETAEIPQPKETEDEDPNNSMSMLSGACSVALALEAAAAAALAAGSPAGLKPCEGPEACTCSYSCP
jgi:hypothetical protein